MIVHYISLKTALSLLTGVLAGLWVLLLGIHFAVLWGMAAFFLNFIPNIGSIMAAIPPVVLALVQHGLPTALLAAAGYLVINIAIGNIIEPRVMGKSLGLSTLVVFVSLIFWLWVLGPVGMLLSVPLTMIANALPDAQPDRFTISCRTGTRLAVRWSGPASPTVVQAAGAQATLAPVRAREVMFLLTDTKVAASSAASPSIRNDAASASVSAAWNWT